MKRMMILASVVAVFLVTGFRLQDVALATNNPAQEEDYTALLKVLSNSKHSLADGVRQATSSTEVPISAKFELDHDGKLALSVYTADKGLTTDPEHNVLKELIGSPEGAEWKPEVEVFKDAEHLKRASGQLTLMAVSQMSLLDVITKAQKQQKGTVFSVTPVVVGRQAKFKVLVADNGKVTTLTL
jgi:hypothetical protein